MSAAGTMVAGGLRGKLSCAESMRRHSSWRAGGVAERMYQPADLDDLQSYLRGVALNEPLIALGLGSNLLVRDGGVRGTMLLMHGALRELGLQADGTLYAQAGVPGAKLARFAALHNLADAEFCAGIPGTLGGMLAMNAGCYGSEIWQYVDRVQVVTRSGELKVRTPQEYEIGYRSVALRSKPTVAREKWQSGDAPLPAPHAQEEFFVGAWLAFAPGDGQIARQNIKELLARRINSQPLNLPNAGSVFRNPPNDHAARLIEQCGLKGMRMGAAEVSGKHANFIVNTDDASAADIETLIERVRTTVFNQTGVKLHTEVKIMGEY